MVNQIIVSMPNRVICTENSRTRDVCIDVPKGGRFNFQGLIAHTYIASHEYGTVKWVSNVFDKMFDFLLIFELAFVYK